MNGAFAKAQVAAKPLPSPQWSPVTSLWGSPAWLTDADKAISRLENLRVGWDGEGGPAPQPRAIHSAWEILSQIEPYHELPPAHIGPTLGGGIGIEWHTETRDIDLEILPDGSVEYLKTVKTSDGPDVNQMEDGQIPPSSLRDVRRLVRWLVMGI
jgi:hypothetical protein